MKDQYIVDAIIAMCTTRCCGAEGMESHTAKYLNAAMTLSAHLISGLRLKPCGDVAVGAALSVHVHGHGVLRCREGGQEGGEGLSATGKSG